MGLEKLAHDAGVVGGTVLFSALVVIGGMSLAAFFMIVALLALVL